VNLWRPLVQPLAQSWAHANIHTSNSSLHKATITFSRQTSSMVIF